MEMSDFVDKLLLDVNNYRSDDFNMVEVDTNGKYSDAVIKHWLNFAVYYERSSVSFIGHWLKSTKEDDVLHYFTRQISDECRHYKLLKRHLSEYNVSIDDFVMPKEWSFLMEDYYPNLNTLVERLAAHNIAAETGALGFLEYSMDYFPEHIKETAKQVLKDEKFHVEFGCKMLRKYCTTKQQQELAYRSAIESLEYMLKARSVFVI